jgi:nitroreductase
MNIPMKHFLSARRSTKVKHMSAPGPNAEELHDILTIAARVPDHKKLVPFRFVVFEGEARADFGRHLHDIFATENPDATPQQFEFERARFLQAPCVIAVISCVKDDKGVPYWEQVLTAGACAYNLCLAANAYGYGTNWLTEWYSYHPSVNALLKLQTGETIAGFVYIGTATEKNPERERPNLNHIVTSWKMDKY